MNMQPIERRHSLSAAEFKEEFLQKNKPLIFTGLAENWPALHKWTPQFFKERYGHMEVPVFSSNYSKPGKGYMSPDTKMPFAQFLDTIMAGPSDLRLFLFDIIQQAPELRQDFKFPTVMGHWITKLPFMFFGAPGSEVTMHYDIDCANVFLTQFYGTKRVILFSPEESAKIYHHPFTVKSLVDPKNPDIEKFPALRNVQGYDDEIRHGETLFMPTRYWHYMHYNDFSYGLALRSQNNLGTALRGGFNVAAHFVIDKGMNALWTKGWHNWKEKRAYENAKVYES